MKKTVYSHTICTGSRDIYFKFEKCVKYAKQMTDEVIYPTQFNIKDINRAVSVNLQQRPLKIGRLIVLHTNGHKKFGSCCNSLFSSLPKLIALFLVILVSKNILKGQKHDLTYLYACWIMWMRYHWQISKQNAKGDSQNL